MQQNNSDGINPIEKQGFKPMLKENFYRGVLIGLGFLFTLVTGGLLAVAVSNINTYSSGLMLST
jgi:hypothetical protein